MGSAFNGSPRGSHTITISKPPGLQAGDVMVAMLGADYSIPGDSPGWTKFAERDENRDLTGQGFFRVATDVEPSSYTWPITRGSTTRNNEIASGTIAAFRGVDNIDPIFSFAINPETAHSNLVSDCPSTDGVAGGALICTWIHDDPQLPQAPPGMTPLSVFSFPNLNGQDDGHATAYKLLTSDGPTGIQSAALDLAIGGGRNDLALAVVLRPALGDGETYADYVRFDAVWKYLDNGSNQGTAWRDPGFDDDGWESGPAQLGYGDGDVVTVVDSGAPNRHITTYFRSSFTVQVPSLVVELTGRLVRDDGAVVYVNGTEVLRSNLPGGTIGYRTRASLPILGVAEDTPVIFSVPPAVLVAGENTIAVEIHQTGLGSSDISFDLELVGLAIVDTEPPTSPDPVIATATSPTTMTIDWTTSTDALDTVSYDLYRDDALVTTTTEATFDDTLLTQATSYEYLVEAKDPSGNTTAASAIGGEVTYDVFRDAGLVATTSDTTFDDTGLTPDTPYEYVVEATDLLGYSAASTAVSEVTPPDTTPPTAPADLTGSPLGISEIEVSWTASVDDVGPVTYQVYRSAALIETTVETTFNDTGLDPGTSYDYTVEAIDGAGNISELVGPVSAETLPAVADPVLIAIGSEWAYLDDGSAQVTSWREPDFVDSSWNRGFAELGYGDGDETALVDGGPEGNRHLTTYFRSEFTVDDPATFIELELQLKRDDGALVYINGIEVVRSNVPDGDVTHLTRALERVMGAAERLWETFVVPSVVLVPGLNVIAVEIHQRDPGSSDISFNLSLTGIS